MQPTSKGNEFNEHVSIPKISCPDLRQTLGESLQMDCNVRRMESSKVVFLHLRCLASFFSRLLAYKVK